LLFSVSNLYADPNELVRLPLDEGKGSGVVAVGASAMGNDGALLRLYLNGAEVDNTPLSGKVDMDSSYIVDIPLARGRQ
jgi:hypothetical protein